MPQPEDTTGGHWAILIGVDFYPRDDGGRQDCLHGAVSDVTSMEQYLKNAPYPVDITQLTATAPDKPESTYPQEDPSIWPTGKNVVESLKRVRSEAKKDDFVYIHFSGHGTKAPVEGSQTEHLALVLYEDKNGYKSYLYGNKLQSCLKSMVKKGLLITLVLDCCFAGSVLRNSQAIGTSIRAIDYDPAVDAAFPPEPWSNLAVPRNNSRQAEVDHTWLVDPKSYTILTACGVFGRAYELEFREGVRRGGLTYFLQKALNNLRERSVEITHASLYSHLCVIFKAIWSAQTPMLYGNRNLGFFGRPQNTPVNPLVSLFWRETGASDAGTQKRLYLGAGGVHGVCEGDTYDAYPLGNIDGASVRVRVKTVHSLNSELVAAEERTDIKQIHNGWNAKQRASMTNNKIAIRIMEDARNSIRDFSALDRLQFIDLLTDDKSEKACQFNVQLNQSRQYCIYDGSMKEIFDPPTPIDKENDLAYVLQRLASYKFLQQIGIERVWTSSVQQFTLEPFINDGSDMGEGGPFHVRHGDKWSLRIKNHGNNPLYLALFHFTSAWKIKDLTAHASGSSFEEIRPKTEGDQEPIRLKMMVPDGKSECEDVIKVFLTSSPTIFPAMNLDKDLIATRGIRTASEAVDEGIGGLPTFLNRLNDLLRHGNGVTEDDNAERHDFENEGWTSRNYIIHTSSATSVSK